MQGFFTGVFALGSAIGPLLGGFIVDHFHWKYIFLLNLPTGALALAMSAWTLSNGTGKGRRKLDWVGSALSITGVSALLLGLQLGGDQWAWASWQSIGLFAGSAVLLVLFAVNELRVPEPILDLHLFKSRTFSTFNAIAFVIGIGMMGCVVFVPWFIQGVVGVSATSSGMVMLPMTICMVIGSALGGQIARRLQYRWQILVGLALVCFGFVVSSRFGAETTLWQARAPMMVAGFGAGLCMPLITLGVQQAFDKSRRAVVTSTTTFFRSVGGTVGVTIFGVIFNKQMTHQFDVVMAPQIKLLPTQIAPLAGKLLATVDKKSDLVQFLIQKPLQEQIPQLLRAPVLAAIKTMMVDALHPVFLTGAAIVLLGALIGLFLGAESLSAQMRRHEGEDSPAVELKAQ